MWKTNIFDLLYSECPPGVHHLSNDFEEAIKWLTSEDMKEKVEKIMIIGGSDIYKVPFMHFHVNWFNCTLELHEASFILYLKKLLYMEP